jgi:hypothetical protein
MTKFGIPKNNYYQQVDFRNIQYEKKKRGWLPEKITRKPRAKTEWKKKKKKNE